MQVSHPYAPAVRWRLAVARRFSSPIVDRLYRNLILPVISEEGLVLECSNALDDSSYPDFWANRMRAILEISDMHILIDMETSGNTEFEFQQSRLMTRKPSTAALSLNFGFSPQVVRTLFAPIAITIAANTGKDKFSRLRRRGLVHYSTKLGEEDFQRRLKNQLALAETERAKLIARADKWTQRLCSMMKMPPNDTKKILLRSMEIAQILAKGDRVDEIRTTFKVQTEEAAKTRRQIVSGVNASNEWIIKLRKGEVSQPQQFIGAFRERRDRVIGRVSAVLGVEKSHLSTGFLGGVISFLVLIATWGGKRIEKRRIRPLGQIAEESHTKRHGEGKIGS